MRLENWHYKAAIALSGAVLVLLAIVGREIYYAANPDRRPKKRKKRRS